jgi:hypothetical protein
MYIALDPSFVYSICILSHILLIYWHILFVHFYMIFICCLYITLFIVHILSMYIYIYTHTHIALTPKILSDQIWVAGYFGQPLTYPNFTIFSSDFLCISLKS